MTRKLFSHPAASIGVIAAVVVGLTLSATSPVRADHILPAIEHGTIAVTLEPIATGMGAPDYAISPPNDDRLFVVEQNGQLRYIQNGALQPTVSLDLATLTGGLGPFNPANANDERGFLGLAFHPNFNTAGAVGFQTLYTYSSTANGTTAPTYLAPNDALQNYKLIIDEFKMSAANPNVVDTTTRREIMSFGKNAGNHNGGTITFGPDGYMYLALGDGGNANDVGASHIEPGGNAQNLTTPLGKMIRIDPVLPTLKPLSPDPISANQQYRIPADNPNMGPTQTVPEIFASGLRNPYRFAFDRLDLGGTGDLILADVGQNNIEEINRIIKGGNYGWAVKEGTFTFFRTTGPNGEPAGSIGANSPDSPAGLLDPIEGTPDPVTSARRFLEYDHGDGISITGGFVYRGDDIPELVGKYVFGDLALRSLPPRVDGRLFYADLEDGTIHEFLLPQFANDQLPDGLTVHGFGEDMDGELYALVTNTPANGTGGIVYKFAVVPEPAGGLVLLTLGALAVVRRRQRD
jgi:glucose/arabinose dehydrogenase